MLEDWRDVLVKGLLGRLDPTDCALLALVGKPWLAVVVASGAPRAGMGGGAVKLKLADFVGSIQMMAWAKSNLRCPCPGWDISTTAVIAREGRLEVLQWARVHDCP